VVVEHPINEGRSRTGSDSLTWGVTASGTRGYALPVSSSASDGLHRIRVTGPDGDPRSIRVAEG